MIDTPARAASLERMALAFEHGSQPMALEDVATQTILECNLAFAGWLGYTKDELSGVAFSRLFGPQEAGYAQAVPAESGRESRDACLQRKDGAMLRVRLEISTGGGDLPGFRIVTLHQLSDGVRLAVAERRVATLKAQLQGLLDTVPAGLAIAEDAGARHIHGNRSLEEMLGMPRGAELSKTTEPELGYRVVRDGSPVPAADLPVQRACRGERVEGEQLEVVCESGRRLFLLASAAPLFDAAGAISGAVGAFLDVTQRVVAERRLAEQHLRLEELVAARTRELGHALADSALIRERFELAMRGANDGLWDWDMLTDVVYYSPRWKAMLGYAEDELEPCFQTWERLVDADGRQRALDLVAEIKAGRTDHFEIEFRMRHKQGHDIHVRSRAFVARNPDGRPVRMVGTHVDVTADKLHEQGLRASREYARAILDSVPAELAVLDRNGQIRTVNAAWRRSHPHHGAADAGAETGTCGKANCLEVCLRGAGIAGPCAVEAYTGICEVLSGVRSEFTLEYARRSPQGERWFLMAVTPLRGDEGGAVVSLTDITERKLAELALQASENRLTLALKAARMGVWERDLRAGRLIWSHECHAIFDAARYGGDFDGFERMILPADAARVAESVRRAVADGSDYSEEYRILRGDGELRWVSSVGRPEYDDQGQPLRVVGIVRDITARKQREAALRESELKFSKAFHDNPLGMSISRMEDGRFLDVNDSLSSIFGLQRNEMIGHTSLELGLWDDPGQRKQIVAVLRRTGRAHNVEAAFHRRNDPTQRTMLISFDILELGGEACLLGTALDITERKALEQALRRESHKNAALLRSASDGIFLMDRNARAVGVSDSTCAMLGYAREELIGMHLSQWDAEYDEGLLNFFHSCLANTTRMQFERRHRRKDGRILDVEISAMPVELDGEPFLFCSSRDVAQRKRNEAALKESEARSRRQSQHLAEVIWGTNIGTWEWNVQTGATEFNERWAEICGYTLAELQPLSIATWARLAHPDDLKRSEKLLERCFSRQSEYYECEARMRHKNGQWIWVLDRGRVVEWGADGRPLRMSGTHQEITERKRAEEALMRKTRELRALLDTIPAPVFFKDQDMRHVEVNQAFCEFVGLPAECIIGCRNQELFSEKVAASYDAGDQAVLQEGRAILGEELEIADAWGRKGWYAIFKSPLYEDDGRIVGLVGLRVDITQRKQGEAERISLLERQRDTLIREVHHRIKNHLQGVIGLLRGHVTRNPETLALIDMVVNQVHAISQVYGLQSRAGGGVLALRRFLEDMVAQRPARLPVELGVAEGLADANLTRESLVPLALVINELLTNAEKHLLPSGPPTIQAWLETRQGCAALRIFGSPARLPDDFDFSKGRGVGAGLDLVRSLLPEGVTLSIHEEAGGVVAELVLTASVLMPLKSEAQPSAAD